MRTPARKIRHNGEIRIRRPDERLDEPVHDPDTWFKQTPVRAEEHFRDRGLRPAIIEKDYYVTEALRIIAETAGDKIIFKGGTSLSKGWNLSSTPFGTACPASRRAMRRQPPLGSGQRPG